MSHHSSVILRTAIKQQRQRVELRREKQRRNATIDRAENRISLLLLRHASRLAAELNFSLIYSRDWVFQSIVGILHHFWDCPFVVGFVRTSKNRNKNKPWWSSVGNYRCVPVYRWSLTWSAALKSPSNGKSTNDRDKQYKNMSHQRKLFQLNILYMQITAVFNVLYV